MVHRYRDVESIIEDMISTTTREKNKLTGPDTVHTSSMPVRTCLWSFVQKVVCWVPADSLRSRLFGGETS
ncbi:unnamed protein product [Linum tenue]|uniref:Uncharacterized protein n=1 Tax=Linum tenue TaxID=586396 RepID=A0AAV0NJJ6_9ROSI|nr:unnamed protein product [Linum tenue]